MAMNYRFGNETDLDLRAAWNQQLVQDGGHRSSMTMIEFEKGMAGWTTREYGAAISERFGGASWLLHLYTFTNTAF